MEYTPFLLSWLPESLLRRFDLVSLDPRGTGGSAPINCPEAPEFTTPNVLTEAGFARAAQLGRQRSQRCIQVLSSRAPHFSTRAAARDIDRLRAAVGDQTLTFLGASYGAKLGAEYAHLFPTSVRAAVLDGPSAPSATEFDSLVRQTRGFEEAYYATNCNDSAVGPTDAQLRTAARAMARDNPVFGAHDAFNLFVCKTWQPQRAHCPP